MYGHKLKESSSIIIVAFPIIHAYSAYSSKYEAYELYNYTSIVTLIIAKVIMKFHGVLLLFRLHKNTYKYSSIV